MIHAHALQGLMIRDTAGRKVGCVHDLRCSRGTTRSEVTHLVYGRRGWLERFGFCDERFDTIPWRDVVELRPREIIVNAPKSAGRGPA